MSWENVKFCQKIMKIIHSDKPRRFYRPRVQILLLCKKKDRLAKLAYLSVIFGHLNKLNKKMQSRNSNVLTSSGKIESFRAKSVL